MEIDGREVFIDKGRPLDKENPHKKLRDQAQPSTVLFIGNLSFGATEDIIWETFSPFGTVQNVRLPVYRDSGNSRGFGYVEFEDVEGAKAAFEGMNGEEIDGRPVRLDYSERERENGGGRRGRGGARVSRIIPGFREEALLILALVFLGPWWLHPSGAVAEEAKLALEGFNLCVHRK